MYNFKVVLTAKDTKNYVSNVKANSITEVITRIRNLLSKYSIKSITRTPIL